MGTRGVGTYSGGTGVEIAARTTIVLHAPAVARAAVGMACDFDAALDVIRIFRAKVLRVRDALA
jgi:hypothetical protein